eukprot:scaffold1841_cov35-Tisochrysis_lutea.AAC.4
MATLSNRSKAELRKRANLPLGIDEDASDRIFQGETKVESHDFFVDSAKSRHRCNTHLLRSVSDVS